MRFLRSRSGRAGHVTQTLHQRRVLVSRDQMVFLRELADFYVKQGRYSTAKVLLDNLAEEQRAFESGAVLMPDLQFAARLALVLVLTGIARTLIARTPDPDSCRAMLGLALYQQASP